VHRLGALRKYGSCFLGRHFAFRQSRKSDCVEKKGVALAGKPAGGMLARSRPRDSSLRRVHRDAVFWDVKEQGERPTSGPSRILYIRSISDGPDDFKRSSWTSVARVNRLTPPGSGYKAIPMTFAPRNCSHADWSVRSAQRITADQSSQTDTCQHRGCLSWFSQPPIPRCIPEKSKS
jgi:hypothetical protein